MSENVNVCKVCGKEPYKLATLAALPPCYCCINCQPRYVHLEQWNLANPHPALDIQYSGSVKVNDANENPDHCLICGESSGKPHSPECPVVNKWIGETCPNCEGKGYIFRNDGGKDYAVNCGHCDGTGKKGGDVLCHHAPTPMSNAPNVPSKESVGVLCQTCGKQWVRSIPHVMICPHCATSNFTSEQQPHTPDAKQVEEKQFRLHLVMHKLSEIYVPRSHNNRDRAIAEWHLTELHSQTESLRARVRELEEKIMTLVCQSNMAAENQQLIESGYKIELHSLQADVARKDEALKEVGWSLCNYCLPFAQKIIDQALQPAKELAK